MTITTPEPELLGVRAAAITRVRTLGGWLNIEPDWRQGCWSLQIDGDRARFRLANSALAPLFDEATAHVELNIADIIEVEEATEDEKREQATLGWFPLLWRHDLFPENPTRHWAVLLKVGSELRDDPHPAAQVALDTQYVPADEAAALMASARVWLTVLEIERLTGVRLDPSETIHEVRKLREASSA